MYGNDSYLQSIPDDPGAGRGTSSNYRVTRGDIWCINHGAIQERAPVPARLPAWRHPTTRTAGPISRAALLSDAAFDRYPQNTRSPEYLRRAFDVLGCLFVVAYLNTTAVTRNTTVVTRRRNLNFGGVGCGVWPPVSFPRPVILRIRVRTLVLA